MELQLRVSIITPSYQQASFLEATIRSVLDQDYPDIEYWVMDGGSTDGSVDIIRQYEHRLAGWVSERDRGQGDAVNKGLNRATGDVIGWLNSDDLYQPGAIRMAVEAFQSHPQAGMVYGDVVSIDGQGDPFNVMMYAPWGLEDLMQFNILGQPGVFMRRSVQVRAGNLDPSFHYMLDHHLWLRMNMLAPMVYVPECLAAARYHAGAKNIALAARFGAEAYRIIAWMQEQPSLQAAYQRLRRRIWAGAYRFDARYLQDGGLVWRALGVYGRCFLAHPPTALKETRRIAFALASLLLPKILRRRVDALKERYLEERKFNLQKRFPMRAWGRKRPNPRPLP